MFTALLLPLAKDLVIQAITVILNGKLYIVINRDFDDMIALRLIIWIVELGHIWVTQSLFCRDAFLRVEEEAAFDEVQGCLISSWEDFCKWPRP
jgi:hypothetical protein